MKTANMGSNKQAKEKLLDKTALKFILVGVINTLVGNGVMFAAYNLAHLGYWPSTVSNYVVGSIVSYFLNKYFTFQSKKKSVGEVLAFVLNITVCYLLAYGAAKPLSLWFFGLFTQNETALGNLSMLAGSGIFIVINYFGQRFVVFRKK